MSVYNRISDSTRPMRPCETVQYSDRLCETVWDEKLWRAAIFRLCDITQPLLDMYKKNNYSFLLFLSTLIAFLLILLLTEIDLKKHLCNF